MNNDRKLIYAAPIIRFIENGLNAADKTRAFGHDAIEILTKIQYAPAVDTVPVLQGKWEWFEDWIPSTPDHPRECVDCGWRCDQCKTALEDSVGGCWDNVEEAPKLRYCPQCGVRMSEGRTRGNRPDRITRCKCCHHWKYVSDVLGDCHHPRFAIPGAPAPTMRPEEFCALGEPREEARK